MKRLKNLCLFVLAFCFLSCASLNQSGFPKLPEDNYVVAEVDGESEDVPANEALVDKGEPVESLPKAISEEELNEHGGHIDWRMPESDLPVVHNKHVDKWIDYFTGRGKPIFEKWLRRQPKHRAMIHRTLTEYGMPKDLFFLAMIESGLNAKAYSRARASGMWQFMKSTGRRYGLHANYWIDERRDPHKATVAAARHLKDLYEEFGDWYLAAAAYNAGSGKVRRAIKRHKTRDYWELVEVRRPYLRAETRNYVPKMLAALIIAKNPKYFGFKPADEDHEEIIYDYVKIDDATDLSVIAKCANVSIKTIKTLNPELRYYFTPPSSKGYQLRLPPNSKEAFAVNYAKIPARKRVTFRRHRLRQGQTLGHVARRYGTSVGAIKRLNKIKNVRRVRSGKVLFIPVPKHKAKTYAKSSKKYRAKKRVAKKATPKGHQAVKHVVRNGDTLWNISMKYGVSVRSIKRWNHIRRSSRIYPGAVLTIYVPNA